MSSASAVSGVALLTIALCLDGCGAAQVGNSGASAPGSDANVEGVGGRATGGAAGESGASVAPAGQSGATFASTASSGAGGQASTAGATAAHAGAEVKGIPGASGAGGDPVASRACSKPIQVALECPPDPPCENENLRVLARREDLARHCLEEATRELQVAKEALQAFATETAAVRSAGDADSDLQEAVTRVQEKTRLVSIANADLVLVRDRREDTQNDYDLARLWRIGGGVTGIAGLAAGSKSLTGGGMHLVYRIDPSLEVGALARFDQFDGDELTSLRAVVGFNDEHWALLLGAGASLSGNDDLLAIATPLAVRFRALNDLHRNSVTPFLDFGVFVEPWFMENRRTTVFFGVSATLGVGFFRGADNAKGLCFDAHEEGSEWYKANCEKPAHPRQGVPPSISP